MKKSAIIITILTALLSWGTLQAQQTVSVAKFPASVVKTVPQSGDLKVDPKLKEISVTFSKDMLTDNMWSWCLWSKDTFPELDKSRKVSYLNDKRTCVLPVKLQADKTYVIWINTQRFNSFRDTGNIPAIPYLLVFKTDAAKK